MSKAAATAEGPLTARDAAADALLDAWRHAGFVEDTLRGFRDSERLDGRDAGLAAEIALGCLRRGETIVHMLQKVARLNARTTPPELLAILTIGVFQIVWLDRVPEFAVVNEAVEQARRRVGGRAPKLVNAVLRNVCRAIRERRAAWKPLDPTLVRVGWDVATRFDSAVLPTPGGAADTVAHVAAAAGERAARMQQLVERHGLEAAEALAWAGQATPPTVLQRNALRCDDARFRSVLGERYGDAVRFGEGCAFLSPAENPVDNAVFADGGAWVQDSTARAAADLLGVQPGERVLDLCAAPGGKAVALAVAMQDRGEIVACDPSARRLRSLTQNLARMDLYCVRAVEIPDDTPRRKSKSGGAVDAPSAEVVAAAQEALGRPFDAVLLDVPCSNSGVIARRPEARRSLTAARLKKLVDLQRRLLLKGAGCCRVGGRLVYSTCSIEPEENAEQVAWLRSAQDRWRVEREVVTLPRWGAEISDWRDGGYAALLVRAH